LGQAPGVGAARQGLVMESASIWSYLHILLFALWLGPDLGVFLALRIVKQPERPFEVREACVNLAQQLHVLPRLCFALMLPSGIELTNALNVYPMNPVLRAAFWIAGIIWAVLIIIGARNRGTPLAKGLSYAEITFEVLAGMGFVAYGLNSLATGSPIDDPWFATKLVLFGVVFWVAIAAELSFHPFVIPFAEIREEGSTFEREEAIARALSNTLKAMVLLYLLLGAIAFLGKAKPF
jgi:hypothetical protein